MSSRSRSSTAIGLLTGIAVVLAIALAVAITYLVTRDNDPAPESAPQTVVVTSTDQAEPAPQPQGSAPAPPPAPSPEPSEPSGSTVIVNGPCLPSQARQFGTDTAGTSLVCTAMGAGDYRWVQHAGRGGDVHNIGEPCDPAVDRVAQDPGGRAIMCSGTEWVTGP